MLHHVVLRSRAHLRVALLLLAGGVFLAAGGCGSDAPTNFPSAHEADVHPKVAGAVEAWIEAQRNMDKHALESLYVHDYHYNGRTAHDMAEVHLLPETHDTRITSITWRLVEAQACHHNAGHECNHDHHAAVMARIHVRGVVGASAIADLATELDDPHDHGHVHAHSVVAPAHGHHHHDHHHISGTVGVSGTYDVAFLLAWDHDEPARIARQRFEVAALQFGGGLAAAVLRDIHVHPHQAHPGETLDVHGRFAMLPPGGVIRARVGGNEAVEAEHDHGEFHVHLTAPDCGGLCLVCVEAYAGNIKSRTASLTIVEREVHVDDHHEHG